MMPPREHHPERMGTHREQLCADLQSLAADLGRGPTPEELDEQGSYPLSAYRAEFGSWANALDCAEVERPQGRRIADESLLAELRRLAAELDKTPSEQDMYEHGQHGLSTYKNRFGTWNEALTAAGLDTRPDRSTRSKEALLADLRGVAEELGHPPSRPEMEECGEFGTGTYRNRFGSWSEALEAAGLESRPRPQKVPRAELLEALTQLADDLGQPPTTTEMKQHGEFSPSVYIDRFGSWQSALHAADLD